MGYNKTLVQVTGRGIPPRCRKEQRFFMALMVIDNPVAEITDSIRAKARERVRLSIRKPRNVIIQLCKYEEKENGYSITGSAYRVEDLEV